jgi:erythromycin esterase-like protein
MWRNTVMLDFVDWLKNRNSSKEEADKAGIYGLDIYSLNTSREAVINHLEEKDPELAEQARKNYGCFDRFADENEYGQFTGLKMTQSCEQSSLKVLDLMLKKLADLEHDSDREHMESHFMASQNAIIVKGAEQYYRALWYDLIL